MRSGIKKKKKGGLSYLPSGFTSFALPPPDEKVFSGTGREVIA